MDEEAFTLLCWLALPMTARQLRQRFIKRFTNNVTLAEVDRVVSRLKAFGFVSLAQGGVIHQRVTNLSGEYPELAVGAFDGKGFQESTYGRETAHIAASPSSFARHSLLSSSYLEPKVVPFAPESVHLQLNNVCNLHCPSCYVNLQRGDDGSLPVERWMTLVDEIADMGVSQLALGGGEPLMSHHFVAIVQQSRRRGLLPNVTTNGHLLTERLVTRIRGLIGEVRLSFNDGLSVNWRLLTEKTALLKAWGMRFGYNVIVTRRNIGQLEEILHELIALHPYSITLIRPKPAPHNEQWYAANTLSAQDSMLLAEQLRRLKPLFADTLLTVDCAFSYLLCNLSDAELALRGVAGCAMRERFVVVAWNGDVYPCSHLHGKEFKMGNVMEQQFRTIWETSSVFTHTHAELRRIEGHCGRCIKRRFCGGCRAIMWHTTSNLRAADAGCPFRP
ncbi:MAG: radical SAM protein [Thaumarchaeota archaeon]|nr:radical SAM protein [Nitrososphaerota archaeon]